MNTNRLVDPSGRDTIIQVMDSLGRKRGGLTRAAFDRFRLLSNDRRAIIVTVAYQPNVRTIFNDAIADGSLPPHTELLNYHEDQREQPHPNAVPISSPHNQWESSREIIGAREPVNSGTLIRYFSAGIFVGLVSRADTGALRTVEKHDETRPWIREYKDTVWEDGTISKREYYDEQNRPRFRIYVAKHMKPYLSVWVNENGYEYRTAEHFTAESIIQGDTRSANASWLARKLDGLGPTTIYTDEPRTTFALTINEPEIHHVTSIHTTHYQNNRDITDGLKHWTSHYVRNFDNIDKIVFFTETQRLDFVKDTNCPPEKTRTIAHAAPRQAAEESTAVERHPRRLVAVSRLSEDKRLDDAIRAFAMASRVVPNAEFRIYGLGSSHDNLTKLIEELNASDFITLEGHTTAPLQCFAGGAASIITSRYEGFGLVLTESFSVGTPVVSYDVIYGPRDMVQDGVNGFLCSEGDVDSLATAIVKTLAGSDATSKLREGALATATRYDHKKWAAQWMETLVRSPTNEV